MKNGLQVDFSSWVSGTSSPDELVLGEPGFVYADLFDPLRLAELTDRFFAYFEAQDPEAFARFNAYRACLGEGMGPEATSEALLAGAPHLSRFVARLFGVEREAQALRDAATGRSPLWAFKKDFAKARVFKPNAGKSWTGTA
ncbi:MAG TPA: pyridine nucleotide-disulfide oxidoreductase, partial [Polyangium sp.]|nr:pyridine nucleotide-disulfide oxidoreductase [Polyangium sp.]